MPGIERPRIGGDRKGASPPPVLATGLCALLQLPRLIAQSAPRVRWVTWRVRSPGAGGFVLVWLSLSAFDHATTLLAYSPAIFAGFGTNGWLAPTGQALIDLQLVRLLSHKSARETFAIG